MAKKRRTRKQQKKQRQARKGKPLQRQQRRGTAVHPPIELAPADMVAIAPLITGSDAQATKNIVDALYESGKWAKEPELKEILFAPEMSMMLFIKAAEEMGHSADSFFDLKGVAFEDAFFDIATVILPVLLTTEICQEILEGLAELSQRYKKRFQRHKAAQVAFVRLLLTDEGQKLTWPQINLLQAIASRSIDAGFKLVGLIEEINQSGDELFDEAGNVVESASISRLTKLLEQVPGMNRVFDQQIDQFWEDAESAVYDGSLHLGLYTEAELERVDDIMVRYLEPARAAGHEGIPDEIISDMMKELNDHLFQLLTPDRLNQMQQRLGEVIREKQIEPKWLGVASTLRDYLGEKDAAITELPFLFRAVMGELRTATRKEEEE